MPITKRAIKKMRHDRKVMKKNEIKRNAVKKAIRTYRQSPTAKTLARVFSLLDKNAKSHIVHRNKASRIKSRLSRLVAAK